MTAARFKWQILASHDADDAVPEWTNNGVPECPHDGGCPHYDGKRCQLMGRGPRERRSVVSRLGAKAMRARRGIVERPKRTPESERRSRAEAAERRRSEPTPPIAGPDMRARILVFGLLAAIAALPAAVAALVWAAALGGGR